MINLFTIFTFHMNFWRAHGNYILKITLCPFLKKNRDFEVLPGSSIFNLPTKLIKNISKFGSHFSVFLLGKQPKNLNFQGFSSLIDPLVTTFSETRAPSSRKYVCQQGIVMPNLWKMFRTFLSHSSVLAFKKNLKI